MDCKMYTQETAEVNGRHAWRYLIDTPIGYIHVVEWELPSMEIQTQVYDRLGGDKAERKFKSVCKKLLEG